MRRPRRPARQLPAVGGPTRRAGRLPGRADPDGRRHSRCSSRAECTTSARPRWSPRSPRRSTARGARRRRADGHRLPVHRGGGGARRRSSRSSSARSLAAERTALLETAPGHATRCVPSPFADDFADREDRLRTPAAAGPARSGSELERLNVGRLRIASKGMRPRADGGVAPVDEERPARRGDVHGRGGRRAALGHHHRRRAARRGDRPAPAASSPTRPSGAAGPAGHGRRSRPAPAPLDIAVVGMACMFPGAPDLAAFWANVRRRRGRRHRGARRPLGPGRLLPRRRRDGATAVASGAASCPTSPSTRCATASRRPRSAAIEPVQLLALEAARRALDDAGYGDGGRLRPLPHLRGLRRGGGQRPVQRARPCAPCCPSYLGEVPAGRSTEQLPRLTEDSFPGMLANVIAGPDRQPARPRRRQLHRGRRLRLLAGRRGRRPARSWPPAPATWCCAAAPTCTTASTTTCCSPPSHALSPTGRSRTFDSAGRRHRARRGRRLRRPQAAGRRRTRRRPRLRRHQGRRRLQRRPLARPDRPAPRGPARARWTARTATPGVSPGRGRAGRGARHRHGRRRPHRTRPP